MARPYGITRALFHTCLVGVALNEQRIEEEEEDATDSSYTLSPASRSSTPRIVEIADEHDLQQPHQMSFFYQKHDICYPYHRCCVGESQRLDQRETAM